MSGGGNVPSGFITLEWATADTEVDPQLTFMRAKDVNVGIPDDPRWLCAGAVNVPEEVWEPLSEELEDRPVTDLDELLALIDQHFAAYNNREIS